MPHAGETHVMTETTGLPAPASARGVAAVRPAGRPLSGVVSVPGDKSISHRAAILAGMAVGTSRVEGFSAASDCSATLACLQALGAHVRRDGEVVEIDGGELQAPSGPLDCGRSGTTMRLLAGALAGHDIEAVLTGHPQLLARPMERVAAPLRRMGADVSLGPGGRAPLLVRGGSLHGIEHRSEVPSAQVKSAILLAGLRADGATIIVEPLRTRDHTERLLSWLGVRVDTAAAGEGSRVVIAPSVVPPFELRVPGDISAAAPILAAAAAIPGSDVTVTNVGLNPTRVALLDVLRRMGATIDVEASAVAGPEPTGDVHVRGAGRLRGIDLGSGEVPALIDELPLIGVLGAGATGMTRVAGAAELRVKESDRIAVLVQGLRALGADARERPDGFEVTGRAPLAGARCEAAADHRLAMAFSVGALLADSPVEVGGFEYVADSFPGFLDVVEAIR